MQSADQTPTARPEALLVTSPEDELRSGKRDGTPREVAASRLSGKKVLIVEDEFFVALQVEDTLISLGCQPMGPITTLDAALQMSLNPEFDIAVLDINLGGKMVYPLADELKAREIPFLLASGYSSQEMPEQYRSLPRVQKPFDDRSIRIQLEKLLDMD